MRVMVLGGTCFLGRYVVERLHERGDEVLVVHRGRSEPAGWVPVRHLHCERHNLADHREQLGAFDAAAVVDTYAMTGADVDAVTPVLPEVPTVVLSSQDVYQAYAGYAPVAARPRFRSTRAPNSVGSAIPTGA